MARILGETPSDQTTKIGFTVEQVAQFPREMWPLVGKEYSEIDILMAQIKNAVKQPPTGCTLDGPIYGESDPDNE